MEHAWAISAFALLTEILTELGAAAISGSHAGVEVQLVATAAAYSATISASLSILQCRSRAEGPGLKPCKSQAVTVAASAPPTTGPSTAEWPHKHLLSRLSFELLARNFGIESVIQFSNGRSEQLNGDRA
jgi:hypothetical protein